MTQYAILVPGIRTKPGGTVGVLRAPLEALGYSVDPFETPYRRLCIDARLRPYWAKMLARAIDDTPGNLLIVNHSDGALITHMALPLVRSWPESVCVVSFNAALDRDARLHRRVRAWDVMHDPTDTWLWLASLIPFGHGWGAMGRHGHRDAGNGRMAPNDARITNWRVGGTPSLRSHTRQFDLPFPTAAWLAALHRQHLQGS